MDINGDGKLTRNELIEGFNKYLGEVEVDIDILMSSCDMNMNGYLDYTEFLAAACNWQKVLSEDRLRQAFNAFDRDGNGKITLKEFSEGFGSAIIEEGYLKELMILADENKDGEIDFHEFNNMMRTSIQFNNRV